MPRVAASSSRALDVVWSMVLHDHVLRASWSPTTGILAVALVSGPVLLFEREGRPTGSFLAHEGGTSSISWSADGHRLVTGGHDSRVRVWDAKKGICTATGDAGRAWVECVACSPVGETFASGAGRALQLWSLQGQEIRRYPDHPSTIVDIQWQRDAPFFATASYGQLAIFSPTTDKPPKSFKWKGSILAIAWSPDGNFAATGNQDATVHFWYRKSGKDLEMSGYPAKVRELAWDHSSRYLATGGSASPTIWDCGGRGPAGTTPIQLDGHQDLLTVLAYQRGGPLLASGSRDGTVYVWHPAQSDQPIGRFTAQSSISVLCWSPDDQCLVVATAGGQLAALAPPDA